MTQLGKSREFNDLPSFIYTQKRKKVAAVVCGCRAKQKLVDCSSLDGTDHGKNCIELDDIALLTQNLCFKFSQQKPPKAFARFFKELPGTGFVCARLV